MTAVRTVAGRPESSDHGKPTKFNEAAEWTGASFVDECSDLEARFRCPGGVCEDPEGAVFVSDAYNHAIRRRDPVVGVWSTIAGKPGEKGVAEGLGDAARFSYPQRIAFNSHSSCLIVAGGGSHVVHQVALSGEVTILAGKAATLGHEDGERPSALFNRPIGLAVDDSSGEVYVGEAGGHVIRKVTKSGVVTTLAGKYKEKGHADGAGAAVRLNQPCGLAFVRAEDGKGSLVICDSGNHCIRQMSLDDCSVRTVAGKAGEEGYADAQGENARFRSPSDVVVRGGVAFVAESGNHCLRRVTLASGAVTTLSGTPGLDGFSDSTAATTSTGSAEAQAAFFCPQGLGLGAKDSLLVADTWNHSIRRVRGATVGDEEESKKRRAGREEEEEDGESLEESPSKKGKCA